MGRQIGSCTVTMLYLAGVLLLVFLSSSTTSSQTTFTTSSMSGCSDNIAFSSNNLPDAKIACYDEDSMEVPFSSEDTQIKPGTSCIYMASGHPSYGLVIEMFCNGGTWEVAVTNI